MGRQQQAISQILFLLWILYGNSGKVRHLELSGNELAEFLLLMEGKTLQGESIGTRNTTWEITREHLPRKMTITGAKQGIELKVSKFTCAANTEQYKICFYDKKYLY